MAQNCLWRVTELAHFAQPRWPGPKAAPGPCGPLEGLLGALPGLEAPEEPLPVDGDELDPDGAAEAGVAGGAGALGGLGAGEMLPPPDPERTGRADGAGDPFAELEGRWARRAA